MEKSYKMQQKVFLKIGNTKPLPKKSITLPTALDAESKYLYGKSVYTVNLRYHLRFKFQFRHLICNEKHEIKILLALFEIRNLLKAKIK